jgi:capsule polysaccharide export protein KpsE/RkpR
MPKPETPEQRAAREYRERTKDISADRMNSYELYSLRLAINTLSDNAGKWLSSIDETLETGLAAIALAASTPEDNSAQIKALTANIRAVREKLKTSVDSQTKGD